MGATANAARMVRSTVVLVWRCGACRAWLADARTRLFDAPMAG